MPGPAKQWLSTVACETGPTSPQKIRPGPPISRLLPAQSPNTPAFRANPYPEVTDPICRLPLPTLFYRPEAIHLGDLLRIWVRADATRRDPHSDFQGPTGHSWTQRELLCSWLNQNPFSPQRNSRASAAYAEKTTLPRAPAGVSESFRVTTLGTRAQKRFRDQVEEYEPHSLSAVKAAFT